MEDPRRWEVFRAADQIRAEGKERVSLRTVWARVKLNAGVAGNNQSVGGHLAEWTRERAYSPIIELAGLPEAVETGLAKAGVALWKAAQAEAAAINERTRLRMAEAIAAERELRHEALGMVDARDAVIEAQCNEIAWFADELERMKEHLRTVRARDFWQRVIQEVRDILPEREALHVGDITLRIGADLVQEAEEHVQAWNVDTVRGAIDERIYRKRYFVAEGGGRYRRRRPEDGGVAA
ncbi:DNA-binding protein [Methylorubrum populi]|uniref:KfrA N-terminal DNA-binding domain-containing protein n=1 Tax=Methylobacterium brachiatum TaxID=269660 RepID=A0AAJ1TMF5_9HYPH|nr:MULTISPECIES: DNA-binding protein [Methylobacterium]MCB4802800.1 DNA-binding protein [Methylobacterium brachiatum]MDQ0543436.1 hypothetical protein [Methylobacterium brachiatum]